MRLQASAFLKVWSGLLVSLRRAAPSPNPLPFVSFCSVQGKDQSDERCAGLMRVVGVEKAARDLTMRLTFLATVRIIMLCSGFPEASRAPDYP